ncbi:MAG: acetoacetate decarboxylase family protein, partial [Nanoarchaeota archaeon]|nr:acetoacetate decarboxylase family protein [Nanoarchaeota archaeon]
PPIYYKNVEAISFAYETDEDAAADILPEGLELTSPATASLTLSFLRSSFSDIYSNFPQN